MVNQDILEGLRLALSRGNNLEQSMLSFFNAGYDRNEIEEAARALYENPAQPLSHPEKPIPEEYKKPIQEIYPPIPTQVQSSQFQPGQMPVQEVPERETQQVISRYGEADSNKKTVPILLLSLFLIILAIALIGILVFKNQLIDFFGTLFS